MNAKHWLALTLAVCAAATVPSPALAQQRPYVGYVYPAGGQQGTTFLVRLGGQNLDGVDVAAVSGAGVKTRVVDYFKRFGNQEFNLMREQLAELQKAAKSASAQKAGAPEPGMMETASKMEPGMMEMSAAGGGKAPLSHDAEAAVIMARIQRRFAEYVQTPACASISSLVFVEVTIAPDAPPGPRGIRLATTRGVSNPLVFFVGQAPETTRKPMISATQQVLGKEEGALRKRPPEEEEVRITLPCTANGQIASGEVNRYRFDAKKGQRLLLSMNARTLVPFVADAVPGWFQPVLTVCDDKGNEVAYCDDYRFKPDPVIFFTVPHDGAYVASVTDAIFRGREDFVYRLTIGEMPYLTGVFPLGAKAGQVPKVQMAGWNLEKASLALPPADAAPGVHYLTAGAGPYTSNRMPLELDTLPEIFEKERSDTPAEAQKVTLPVIVNGRIDRPDDWDVFQFSGRAGETVVAEVTARRLDSPLDSVLKLTDDAGRVLAMNDDHQDPEAGVNTHDADSYLMVKLPTDGNYFVHVGDTDRHGGPQYAYRLRISHPIPDFALFVVPSSAAISAKGTNGVSVQAIRKDGYTGPITLALKDPPEGFSSQPVTIPKDRTTARFNIKTTLVSTTQPVDLVVEGKAKIDQRDVAHAAVAAEDRMQAFLWRHLVPAGDLAVVVWDPNFVPLPKRIRRTPAVAVAPSPSPAASPSPSPARPATASASPKPSSSSGPTPAASGSPKPTFTKQQVANLVRQIKSLYDEGLITDEFYDRKMAECEAAQ